MYPELMLIPMREELTRAGVQELRSAAEVERAVATPGTTMIIVNSVCGCAARNARPAVARALQHSVKPAKLTTVFAGQDAAAVQRARSYFTGYPPSSPSIALLREGHLLFMLERHQIEDKGAEQIAEELKNAFEQHCCLTSTSRS